MAEAAFDTIGAPVWQVLWDGSVREHTIERVTRTRIILAFPGATSKVQLNRDGAIFSAITQTNAVAGGTTFYVNKAQADAAAARILERKVEQQAFAKRAREQEDRLRAQGFGGWQN